MTEIHDTARAVAAWLANECIVRGLDLRETCEAIAVEETGRCACTPSVECAYHHESAASPDVATAHTASLMTGLCSAHRDGEDPTCDICYPSAPYPASEHTGSAFPIPWYAMLDVWTSLGGDSQDFELWMNHPKRTPADAWSQLMAGVQRNIRALLQDTNPPAGSLLDLISGVKSPDGKAEHGSPSPVLPSGDRSDDLMDELRAALLREHDDNHATSFDEGCGCETCQLILRVWEQDHSATPSAGEVTDRHSSPCGGDCKAEQFAMYDGGREKGRREALDAATEAIEKLWGTLWATDSNSQTTEGHS